MMFARSFACRTFLQQCSRNSTSSELQFFSNSAWRQFSTSSARAQAPPKPKQPVAKYSRSEETLKFAGRRPEGVGVGKLARKVAEQGEVILFVAPSHRSYVLGAYAFGAFCFAYSVYNSNITFRDPIVPLPMWQQGLLGGICVAMSVMGTVFISKTGRLIRTIKAINRNGTTCLRFNVRHIVPFMKPYEFEAVPREIAFSKRLVMSPESLLATENAGVRRSSDIRFFKHPVRKVSVILWRVFCSIRQIFTSENFVLLEVEGQKGVFRMDSGGFISEDFLVIGNPISLKS